MAPRSRGVKVRTLRNVYARLGQNQGLLDDGEHLSTKLKALLIIKAERTKALATIA